MTLAESGGFDGNAGETGVRLGLDENLYILPKCNQEVHRALHGKAFQLVIQQGGDLRLIDAERSGNLRLGELLPFDDLIQGGSQSCLGVEFRRIRQTHIGEYIAAAWDDLICCALTSLIKAGLSPGRAAGKVATAAANFRALEERSSMD